MRIRGGPLVALLLTSLSIMALVQAATPSGMGFVGVHTAGQESFDETLSVALSPDGSLLATGTEGYVVISRMSDRSVIETISVADHVTALEFSPNGEYLALGLRSDSLSGDALRVLLTEDWSVYEKSFANGKNPRDISFSDAGDKMLLQGQDGDIFELSFPEFSILGHMTGHHLDDITCTDYGYGGLIAVSGGLDGKIAFWDLSDYSLSSSLDFEDSEIVDCLFNPSSSQVAILTNDGKVRSYWLNGSLVENSELDFIQAKQLQWSHEGDHLYVLETNILPSLQRVRVNDWVVDEFTYIGHNVNGFDLSNDEDTLVTSTGTIHSGVYQSTYFQQGFGEPGDDFDQDGVPDHIDVDDDGDGILDIYDYSCSSSDCTKDPDPNYMRNIEFEVSNEELIISDSISFDRYDSNALRNLTTSLLSDDNKISVDELTWMSTAMCDNIRHRDVIDQWHSMIEVEGSQLSNGTLSCEPVSGISSNDFGDLSLRATFTWVTTFDLSSAPIAPYNITVKGIIFAPTGSSAIIAPQFPASIDFVDLNAENNRIDLWNRNETTRIVLMEELEEEGPGLTGLVASFISDNYWIPIISFLGILVGLGLIIKQNKDIANALIRGERDEDDEEEEEDDYDDESYDDSYLDESEYEEEDYDDDSTWSSESESLPPRPKRGPPRKSTRRVAHEEYPIDDSPPVKARRKRVSSKQPIGSKRRTLSESVELDYDYGQDGVYHDGDWDTEYDVYEPPQTKVRKVRKVENVPELEEEVPKPEKKKGRRKVKRRNNKKEKTSSKAAVDDSIVAKKVVATKKRKTGVSKKPQDDGGKDSSDDEESAMDKALGMLTGDKD